MCWLCYSVHPWVSPLRAAWIRRYLCFLKLTPWPPLSNSNYLGYRPEKDIISWWILLNWITLFYLLLPIRIRIAKKVSLQKHNRNRRDSWRLSRRTLETAFDYYLYLFLIRLLISPPANIKCIRWSYRRLNTLETKASFPQQSGHPRPLAID